MRNANARPLSTFCRDFMLLKFGIRKMADRGLCSLVMSLATHWRSHPKIRVFGLLCGMDISNYDTYIKNDQKEEEEEEDRDNKEEELLPLSTLDLFSLPSTCSFFLRLLSSIYPTKEIGGRFGSSSCIILKTECDMMLSTHFHVIQSTPFMDKLKEDIETLTSHVPPEKETGAPRVDVDELFELVFIFIDF